MDKVPATVPATDPTLLAILFNLLFGFAVLERDAGDAFARGDLVERDFAATVFFFAAVGLVREVAGVAFFFAAVDFDREEAVVVFFFGPVVLVREVAVVAFFFGAVVLVREDAVVVFFFAAVDLVREDADVAFFLGAVDLVRDAAVDLLLEDAVVFFEVADFGREEDVVFFFIVAPAFELLRGLDDRLAPPFAFVFDERAVDPFAVAICVYSSESCSTQRTPDAKDVPTPNVAIPCTKLVEGASASANF